MLSHYYHFASKGLQDDILFENVASYVAGMNRVATCYVKCSINHPVRIFAFCLMDNHVHFILYGCEDDCIYFMDLFKKLTEMWLNNHSTNGRPHKNWEIGHWLIKDKEALVEKISYVLRNPAVAGMPYSPFGYPWGSGSILFSDISEIKMNCRRIDSFSIREKKRLFNSHVEYPDDWLVQRNGCIWPGCYIDFKSVEKLYQSALKCLYEMNKRVEESVNMEMLSDSISLPDGEVLEKGKEISNELFDTVVLKDLSIKQRVAVGKQIHKDLGASVKQISRILGIKPEDLKMLI